jgi:hypothetical protein
MWSGASSRRCHPGLELRVDVLKTVVVCKGGARDVVVCQPGTVWLLPNPG